jgi:D-glycero-D-manno-heptose 1,7-bisphosphate phosphatase
MKRCVFFDRDGIVNESPGPGYVVAWEEFRLRPGFPAALRTVLDRGYEAVIVTNQRGVALGIMSSESVERIHDRLRRLLEEQHGLRVLDILFCPHDDGQCKCRKPQPGMLTAAADRYGIDLRGSWMVGDGARDVEAGRRAGCRTILVGGRPTEFADYAVADLDELQALLGRVLGGGHSGSDRNQSGEDACG